MNRFKSRMCSRFNESLMTEISQRQDPDPVPDQDQDQVRPDGCSCQTIYVEWIWPPKERFGQCWQHQNNVSTYQGGTGQRWNCFIYIYIYKKKSEKPLYYQTY